MGVAASPADVHAYLSDAGNLPAWAPGFAPRISPSGSSWLVTRDDGEFTIDVVAEPRSRAVDFVSASDHARGLFARVLPNGGETPAVSWAIYTQLRPLSGVSLMVSALITWPTSLVWDCMSG